MNITLKLTYKKTLVHERCCFGCLFALYCFALFASFKVFSLENIDILFAQEQIQLDGILDEAVWERANRFELNYVTDPYENTQSPVKTNAYIFENGGSIFIGFEALDPEPQHIRAYLRDRDTVWEDDLVGVVLDTYGSQKLGHHFYVNPKNVQIDSIENESTGAMLDDWHARWYSQTSMTADGYSVEIEIPMSSLQFRAGSGKKQWSLELVRLFPRDVKYRMSHLKKDRNNECSLCQLAKVSGFERAQSQSQFYATPSIFGTHQQNRNVYESAPWQKIHSYGVGVDAQWNISSDEVASLTINPDFSQIEADNAQLSVNNTFSLYFPEKRQFFLQNQNYFDSFYQLLHTRNLISPDVGLKYTARSNRQVFAALVANDTGTSLLIPGNLGSATTRLESESTNAAFRYRYDFNANDSIGLMTTYRNAEQYYNHVLGIDGQFRFTDSTSIRWQILGSETQYPDQLSQTLCYECSNEASLRSPGDVTLQDYGWQIEFSHSKRNWWVYTNHIRNGKDLRLDLGFQDTVDYEYHLLKSGYISYKPFLIWNKQQIWGAYNKETNIKGETLSDNREIQLELSGNLQSEISVGIGRQRQVGQRFDVSRLQIDGNTPFFELDFAFVYAQFRPKRDIYSSMLLRKGEAIDYANNRPAKQLYWQPIISWDATEQLFFKVTYTYENLDSGGQNLYIARLIDLRTTFQFNNASKIRASLIHNNIGFSPDNYNHPVDHQFRSLGTQVVYSYRLDAFSAFYLGYSSNSVENDMLGRLTQEEQNLFAKFTLSY